MTTVSFFDPGAPKSGGVAGSPADTDAGMNAAFQDDAVRSVSLQRRPASRSPRPSVSGEGAGGRAGWRSQDILPSYTPPATETGSSFDLKVKALAVPVASGVDIAALSTRFIEDVSKRLSVEDLKALKQMMATGFETLIKSRADDAAAPPEQTAGTGPATGKLDMGKLDTGKLDMGKAKSVAQHPPSEAGSASSADRAQNAEALFYGDVLDMEHYGSVQNLQDGDASASPDITVTNASRPVTPEPAGRPSQMLRSLSEGSGSPPQLPRKINVAPDYGAVFWDKAKGGNIPLRDMPIAPEMAARFSAWSQFHDHLAQSAAGSAEASEAGIGGEADGMWRDFHDDGFNLAIELQRSLPQTRIDYLGHAAGLRTQPASPEISMKGF